MASTSVYVAGCRAKLERALHHHLDLEQECAAWLSTRPYEITHEYRADAGEYVIRCKKAPDPPLVIGTVIGDILANLRSCLDNLAYALAVENTGDPPSGADKLEFPIFRSAADYEKWGTRKVRWLAADAQIAIRQLQPLEDGAAPRHRLREPWGCSMTSTGSTSIVAFTWSGSSQQKSRYAFRTASGARAFASARSRPAPRSSASPRMAGGTSG